MLSHNQIKYINSLKIKKYRSQHNAFTVEGEKSVSELLNSRLEVKMIVATRPWLDENTAKTSHCRAELLEVTDNELSRISDLTTPNRVLAVAAIPAHTLPQTPAGRLTLMLDGVRDPGNLGTIARTADWFGVDTVICSDDTVDFYNPKTIQASMGSFARVKVLYTDLATYLGSIQGRVKVYGAMLEGTDISKKQFSSPALLLLGSESHGISDKLKPFITDPVHIPRLHEVTTGTPAESLNVSIANAVICYEICKQLS